MTADSASAGSATIGFSKDVSLLNPPQVKGAGKLTNFNI
jgi:hypothetical protein